jgi:hypothetical protein
MTLRHFVAHSVQGGRIERVVALLGVRPTQHSRATRSATFVTSLAAGTSSDARNT